MKVIDLECMWPVSETGVRRSHEVNEHPVGPISPHRLPPRPGYGFANYANIFRSKAAELAAGDASASPAEVRMTDDAFVALMDRAGVEIGVFRAASNEETVRIVQAYPDRFIGLAYLSPFDGMRGVRELERLVREGGLRGFSVGALYEAIPPDDRRYYPFYAKCVELNIPVRIYTSMSYANDRPYDLAHPRHLDQIACDFPELRIVAGLAGWPWVEDMVALLRRHPNLYCDTAAHRPKYFAKPGSGWEMFMQFGNTLIQDKIMVGLSWLLLGDSMENLIAEYLDLPLKDSVKEKWLYRNARRFFELD
jgi:predicted TIM-barrel fold metal-dependent hydrolase